jgi:hypothetical protein
MCKLELIILTVGLVSVPASAQSSIKPKCPAGYDLVGTYCQNNSTGDIVLPNQEAEASAGGQLRPEQYDCER